MAKAKAKTKTAEQKAPQDGNFILAINQHLMNLAQAATGGPVHVPTIRLDDLFDAGQWAEFRMAYENLFGLEIRKRLLKSKGKPRFSDIIEYTLRNVSDLPTLAVVEPPVPREMVTAKPSFEEVRAAFRKYENGISEAMARLSLTSRENEECYNRAFKAREELKVSLKGLNGLDAHIDWL